MDVIEISRVDVDKSQIQQAILAIDYLKQDDNIPWKKITAEELMEYFSGPTPYGDTTTLASVIENPWLMLHELAELSVLKSMGHVISRHLVWQNTHDVLKAHASATELEITLAIEHRDIDWINQRVKTIRSWLDDPGLASDLKSRYKRLVERCQNA
jgi:hypothetical protein